MAEYIAGERLNAVLTLVKEFTYLAPFGWRGTEMTIYIFKDESENVIVWKTSSILGLDIEKGNGIFDFEPIRKGDKIRITATVKELSEYKGEPQVIITRAKVKEMVEKALTKEEMIALKRNEQIETLTDGDFLWEIEYRRYKMHYADCETLAGSYIDRDKNGVLLRAPKITIIVRNGRLKPSGTRGLHYSGYEFENENGEKVCYRAICEENAEKRAKKDFPDHSWECCKIYNY